MLGAVWRSPKPRGEDGFFVEAGSIRLPGDDEMANVVLELTRRGIAHPPAWLPLNTHYLTIMGSEAYGVSRDSSDLDIYGFCIPPKEMVFPHLAGEIVGFGTPAKRFAQWQEHHLRDGGAGGGAGRTYDLTVYGIVSYFHLLLQNNPNLIDSLFTPDNCVLHITRLGTIVRERRRQFLHKGCWHTFKGYAYAQMKKMRNKSRESVARQELIATYGYDVKFAYHLVRLLDEAEQILTTGDLDLQQNREQLKAIRAGAWTEEQLESYFSTKESQLEELYHRSTLPYRPDEDAIRALLLQILEEHYGSLAACVVREDAVVTALRRLLAEADAARAVLEAASRSTETPTAG